MKAILIIFLSLLLFKTELVAQRKFVKTASGARYKIVKSENGKKIHLNDVITVNFKLQTEKGRLLYSSYENADVYKLQVHASEELMDLMDIFINLHEKDSAVIYVPADSAYKDTEASRPEFLPKKSSLVFLVKIESVQSEEEAIAEEKKAFDNEREQLKNYLRDNNLEAKATRSGLIYVITHATQNASAQLGDTIFINYVARTINGKVFDTNIEAEARKANLQHADKEYKPISFIIGETGIITPWEEGILMMNEGGSAKFIIPSFLAFGSTGLGKIVKPYTTFVIDVDIVEIRKAINKTSAEKQKNKQLNAQSHTPNFLPKQIINRLSSFLFLIADSKPDSSPSYKILESNETRWYLIWLNSIKKLLH